MIEIPDDAFLPEGEAPPQDGHALLGRIGQKVSEHSSLKGQLESLEEQVKVLKEEIRRLEERDLPDLMLEVGLTTIKTDSGFQVEIGTVMSTTESASAMPRRIAFLRQTGNEELIKQNVSLQFGKGMDEKANEAIMLLRGSGFAPTREEEVHTGSFKALIKELREQGKAIPYDELGIYVAQKAIIKPVKSKK